MDDLLKRQISEALQAQPSPTRAMAVRRDSLVLAGGFATALAAFLACGGFRDFGAPRPPALIAITLVGTLAIAVGALRATRRRAALPAPREVVLAVLVAVPTIFFGWKTLWSFAFGAYVWWPTRPGLLCLGVSLLTGGAILVSLVGARRRSDPIHPTLTGAALGVASGAAAAVLVDLWCPVGHPAHVALGHVLPMVLLGALGAWPGGRVLAVRR